MTWIEIVPWLVRVLGVYAVVGLLFAIAFVARGIERVDPGAHGSGWGFRLVVFPGVAAFWPLLLKRWMADDAPQLESNAHRRRKAAGRGAAT